MAGERTYASEGAGANLEFTGATAGTDRANYNVTVAGSILRVAENP